MTGVVLDEDDRLLVDVGSSPQPRETSFDATASFFTPQAMFRVRCLLLASGDDGGQYEIIVEQVDRIERRVDRRIDLDVRCTVTSIDDGGCARSVIGRTRNVSRGGCRLMLDRPCPAGDAPMVALELADGSLIAEAFVIACDRETDHGVEHWDYRLAFTFIDPADLDRLAALV